MDYDDGWDLLDDLPGGWLGLVVLILAIVIFAMVCQNEQECAQKKCTQGAAKFIEGECYCVFEGD